MTIIKKILGVIVSIISILLSILALNSMINGIKTLINPADAQSLGKVTGSIMITLFLIGIIYFLIQLIDRLFNIRKKSVETQKSFKLNKVDIIFIFFIAVPLLFIILAFLITMGISYK